MRRRERCGCCARSSSVWAVEASFACVAAWPTRWHAVVWQAGRRQYAATNSELLGNAVGPRYACSVGASGEEQSFQNPLFQTWGMFLGMVFALPVHFAREALERRRSRRGYDAIGIERRPSFKEMPRSTYLLLAAPALFDLAATALCMFGLTRVAVSVYQMLRGAAIVFVAILKHFVLKDKLAKYLSLIHI